MRDFKENCWYNISLGEQSCDCPQFSRLAGECQHLNAVGIYPLKPFVRKTHPTFSQALSGLVKSLRIRRVEEAVYWLVYLDTFKEPRCRFRTARRLLIGSAEDGHSIKVMEKLVESFSKISKPESELRYLVAEAIRICNIPNWWHPSTGGPDYIYSGMVGQRDLAYYRSRERSAENMANLIVQGIEQRDKRLALAGVMGLFDAKVGGTKQAALILGLTKKYKHSAAERLATIHLRARSALSSDNNFLCQAAWLMAGGASPVVDAIEAVSEAEVMELIDRAKEKWKSPKLIPGWCCDGVHSAGNDVRFMGEWREMFTVCRAFEHYGRVDPEDEWLQDFKCYDGLILREVTK